MILVTLEGLPHSGKSCILRNLVQQRPGWVALNVAPEGPSVVTSRVAHTLFAALMRKVRAVCRTSTAASGDVVLLNAPWFEHLPRHTCMWHLLSDMTHELTACLGCRVDVHAMFVLHVPHDETFEQMVCCGNPFWNSTSLADVHAAQDIISQHLEGLARCAPPPSQHSQHSQQTQLTQLTHPFPCRTFAIECPAFFEENEVLVQDITRRIVEAVEAIKA